MKIIATMLVLVVLSATGCGDGDVATPSTTDFDQRRAALKERLAKSEAATAAPKAEEAEEKVAPVSYYSSKGKRDPFRAFIWEPLDNEEIRGPLEQYDVAQLSLLAVIWSKRNARALIVDPAGQSFIVAEGTKVGKNSGQVTKIQDNLVVVKEIYVDFTGQKTIKDVEMRIRTSEGG